MAPLRVMHLITQLELGGAQRNTLYTVRHLHRETFSPSLACGRGGRLDPEAQSGPWETTFIEHLVRPIHPLKDVLAFLEIYKLLRRKRPHVLHTHSSKAGILGRLAGYLAGVPVIVHTFHGFGFTPQQQPLIFKAFVLAERICARLSSHLIFVSKDNEMEAAALGIGKGKPTSLIRSGIQIQTAPSPAPLAEEFSLSSGFKIVTSVGNFKPQKNPLDLIRVASAAIKKDSALHFFLVGDGELRQDAESLAAQEGIQDRVHFLGWRDDIPRILAATDIFLLTSLWEGLPRALVEAFVARRPAVAYGVNGVRDILIEGENGFLIPPGDWATAAEKVCWLSAHPEDARAMGFRGHEKVVREFDIDLMVRQQEALYSSLFDSVPLKDYYQPHWNPAEPT